MYGQNFKISYLLNYVFDQCIQNLEGLMKIVVSIDTLLLLATYQYVHENIRVMNI